MRIIARRMLRDFARSRMGHKDEAALKAALDAWFDEVRKARWTNTAEVKRLYATASVVSADRIVFNIMITGWLCRSTSRRRSCGLNGSARIATTTGST